MSNITPGPWELLPGEHDIISEPGSLIATVYPGGYTRDGAFDEARRRANARAIVEVPALIEALREMTAIARCIGGSFALRGEYGWEKHDEAELDKAEALLDRLDRKD